MNEWQRKRKKKDHEKHYSRWSRWRLRTVWPDLVKFRHFGKILKVFGQFLKGLINICQNFESTWHIFMLSGKFWFMQMAKFW